MNLENNKETVTQQEVNLSLSLGDINKILATLGNLPYAQVYDLIHSIRTQTEIALDINNSIPEKENKNYEHTTANS